MASGRNRIWDAADLIARAPLQMFAERGRVTAIATVQVSWRTDLWGTALYPTKTLAAFAGSFAPEESLVDAEDALIRQLGKRGGGGTLASSAAAPEDGGPRDGGRFGNDSSRA